MSQRYAHRWLALILAGYFVITVAYGFINPLFEAPDEHWHYFTAQFIADTGQLPAVAADPDPFLSQEAAQPPLYYLLGAALIAPIDTSSARTALWPNPFAFPGDASVLANVNQFIHAGQETWPWQGYALAAHVLRLFSTLLGLGTLLCVYKSGRFLWPAQCGRALLATALVAFLPQFNFLHASISNDPLIILLCSAGLVQLLALWQGHSVTSWRLLLLGISIGLAALTKNAGVLLLAYAIGLLVLLTVRQQKLSLLRDTAVYLILPALFIAGWLWWRNWQLYGDFTATNQFLRFDEGDRNYTLVQALDESGGLWRSAIAVFGWFNVLAPTWFYAIWIGIAALALMGSLMPHTRRQFPISDLHSLLTHPIATAVLLAGWFLLVYAGLLRFMMITPAAQGRLLFPAIIPLALGLAYGLSRWRFRWLYAVIPALALFTTLFALVAIIHPTYARPPIVSDLPATATRLDLPMGDGLTLVGVEEPTDTAVPGNIVWFTLYWTAASVPAAPPELVLELFGRDLTSIGRYHAYHGRGLYPANLWPSSGLIADRIGIRLKETADTPLLAPAFVNLIMADTAVLPESVPIGSVKVIPTEWPEPGAALAQLGASILLTAVATNQTTAQPGDIISINVTWHVLAPPNADYTTLIHLAEPGQPPLATGDSPPRQGDYPTRVWAAGEVIDDSYQLAVPADLPDGRYPLWIGMYDPTTFARQPLTINGEHQPNDAYQIGWLEITTP